MTLLYGNDEDWYDRDDPKSRVWPVTAGERAAGLQRIHETQEND